MKTLTRSSHGIELIPFPSQMVLSAMIRVLIGAMLLGVMVLAGIALGYAGSMDLQL